MDILVGDDNQREYEIDIPKARFIEWIVMAIVYFLAFLFFLYITVVVVRKEEKLDKVLLSMLLFLQLSALSKYL